MNLLVWLGTYYILWVVALSALALVLIWCTDSDEE